MGRTLPPPSRRIADLHLSRQAARSGNRSLSWVGKEARSQLLVAQPCAAPFLGISPKYPQIFRKKGNKNNGIMVVRSIPTRPTSNFNSRGRAWATVAPPVTRRRAAVRRPAPRIARPLAGDSTPLSDPHFAVRRKLEAAELFTDKPKLPQPVPKIGRYGPLPLALRHLLQGVELLDRKVHRQRVHARQSGLYQLSVNPRRCPLPSVALGATVARVTSRARRPGPRPPVTGRGDPWQRRAERGWPEGVACVRR